jgi:pyruvyltransferase
MPTERSIILKAWIPRINWGDFLNLHLTSMIAGVEPTLVHAFRHFDETNYMAVGSVLEFADKNTIVWGSGLIEDKKINKPKQVLAVRGPLTRQALIKQGIDCPEIYGDPALLLPRYYQPKVEKKFKKGIIPHWEDVDFVKAEKDEVIIYPHTPMYEYIDLICSCEKIESSSLHGLIVADAYGVPCKRIKINKEQLDFKFDDYELSKPLVDLDKLLRVCPFMRKIIISPFSRKLRSGKTPNPKDYPYWEELIKQLKEKKFYVIQVGVFGEKRLNVDEVKFNLSLVNLEKLIKECYTWISVDNFFQHLAANVGKKGIVLWGQSNPKIFGYPENANLLKDEKYLRDKQFDIWDTAHFIEESFVEPKEVIKNILEM